MNSAILKSVSLLVAMALPLEAAARELPVLKSSDAMIEDAWNLAVRTVENNIADGIIKAGGDYGGEWTRDASINAWNAGSLVFPEESRNSLWSVTVDSLVVGHQYWDKIIWVQGAFNHHLVTGDPVKKIYECCAATMKGLEDTLKVAEYGLFRGPSVFNDGIAGYEVPVAGDTLEWSSVLMYPNAYNICCLSTNCAYYMAYRRLASMAWECGKPFASARYRFKACRLRKAILDRFYDRDNAELAYLIDHNGDLHHFQEALGWSFAILSGIIPQKDAPALVASAEVSDYGITSICPDFKRFDSSHPGRHNNIVWPFVNAFWAEAALQAGDRESFEFELRNLAFLAMEKGGGMFYEIYNALSGEPDGGWQVGHQWVSSRDQTWSATGYMRMVLNGVFGISFSRRGMIVNPPAGVAGDLGISGIEGLKYRRHKVSVSFLPASDGKRGVYVNGSKVRRAFVPCRGQEDIVIDIYGAQLNFE